MTNSDDLNKLFEAALGGKQAPSRFGTPEEMRKSSPVPVQQSRFQAQPAASAFQPAAGQAFQQPAQQAFQPAPQIQAPAPQASMPEVPRDAQGNASLDSGLNAELAGILDVKMTKAKSRRRRGLVITLLVVLGTTGGTTAWFVSSPERLQAFQKTIADIKSAGDIKGMVASYQQALDRVAVRSQQVDEASESMGVDTAAAANMGDQGFDAEMREMMGEEGGPTSAARNAKLAEKFKSVKENGTLMPGKKD